MLSISNVMYVQFFMKTAGENLGFLVTYSQGMYTVQYMYFDCVIKRQS